MKLLDKYNRVSLITTILVIVVTGFVYYFTISYILTGQVDKDLLVEENEIFDYVKLNHQLPQVFKSEDLKIKFQAIGSDTVRRRFVNTRYYDEKEHDLEAGRTLFSSVKVGNHIYSVDITESKVETEDLIRVIFIITLAIILILLIILLLINRLLMRKLWQPFYQTLSEIKLFNVADRNGIRPVDTRIDEFHDLNQEVTAMSQRVLNDYQSLKNFTENAAHELMTPLAVILSKLETLMQDGEITPKQGALIAEAYETVGRLKKLNRSMLLLSRIENKLMPEMDNLDLKRFIEEKMLEFQEMIADKQISLRISLQPSVIRINPDLLNILFNNLLGNAISHNRVGGELAVHLNAYELFFTNTGAPGALDDQTIFQRFHKSPESEGSGLGLTLARQICDNCGFTLQYNFVNGLHCFMIRFPHE